MPGAYDQILCHNMDASVRKNLHSVLIIQGQLMNKQQERLQATKEKLMQLTDALL